MSQTSLFADSKFRKKFLAMAVGNAMEWYDFAIFGALADVIGEELFPPDTEEQALLKGLAVFGAAFLMRPVGGILMGWIGDTMGTKKALEISIALMLFPSLLIGCIPAYGIGGLVSTVILIVLRLIQGLAVGGELVGAFIFTIEATGGKARGFWGGACESCAGLGVTLGMGVVAILRAFTTKEELRRWGWRLPFLGSILFGIIGVWLRSQLEDEVEIIVGDTNSPKIDTAEVESWIQSELEIDADNDSKCAATPLVVTLLDNYRELLLVIFVSAFWGVSYYTNFVWIAYFMGTSLIGGDGIPNAWLITFFLNCVLVVALPLGGMLGDYIGQILSNEEKGFRVTMQLGTLAMIILAIPAFGLIATRTQIGCIIGVTFLLIPTAFFGANLPAFMVCQFPKTNRYTGIGIAYNVANAIFSGTAPFVQTSLVLSSSFVAEESLYPLLSPYYILNDGRLRPAYYLTTIAFVSFLALTFAAPYCEQIRNKKEENQELSEKEYGKGKPYKQVNFDANDSINLYRI